MNKTYRPYEPNQSLLLPPSLKEWLPEGHLVYFVSDVVDELDLTEIYESYEKEGRGYPPYEPGMMVKLLIYGYCVGVPSSRRIARELEEDVAFRILASGNRPDFRTIAAFRRRHLGALQRLFVKVLRLCQEAGLVKLGHVSLDSTKIKANASKHKAMSYERMLKKEQELQKQIEDLMRQAQVVDEQEDQKYGKEKRGDELPEELSRRKSRLAKIREAKEALEHKAREEAAQKREQRESKEQQAAAEGRSLGGREPVIDEKPQPKAQRNFTDPQSKIMKGSDGFIQGYNAQAVVDSAHQIIVAAQATSQAADAPHVKPMMQQVQQNTGKLPDKASLDAGYFSEDNVGYLEGRGIDAYVATGRQKHGPVLQTLMRGRIPKRASVKDRMKRKLATQRGRAIYARRKCIVEPVFGQIKGRGFRQFLLRGQEKVEAEWSLMCTSHNLLKLYRSGRFWRKN
jgi:transposase